MQLIERAMLTFQRSKRSKQISASGLCTLLASWSILGLFYSRAHSQDEAVSNAEQERTSRVIYERDVRPILRKRCIACHGALKQESGLRLDTAKHLLTGSEEGAIVQLGSSEGRLLQRIASREDSFRMPPDGKPLSPNEVDAIRRWLVQGAKHDPDEPSDPDPREHWAFQIPRQRPIDKGQLPSAHPIDGFLSERLEKVGIVPNTRSDKETLLRRLSIDLIGLPPSAEELATFLDDESEQAYERQVDRLLADPRHGERWGRHWMDVWRYADWHGRRYVPDVWNSAPQIWRWRDWIVQSLNQDRGYDQMIREMLAADEVAPGDASASVATGFLIRNWYALNPNDWMRANVEHTSKAFLGLTMNCAHCHDHKYDPISQEDYFRFRAYFEPIQVRQDRVLGEADPGPFQEYDYSVLRKVQRLGAVSIFDQRPDAATYFYTGGDERNRMKEKGAIAPGLPLFLQAAGGKPVPVEFAPESYYPGLRPSYFEAWIADQEGILRTIAREKEKSKGLNEEKRAPLLDRWKVAQKQLQAIEQETRSDPTVAPLSGSSSLLLDAESGRRMIHHRLSDPATIEPGTVLELEVALIQDAHFNFQLAEDVELGKTASFVGFEKGRILAYKPGGGHQEFEVGRYELPNQFARFTVRWEFTSNTNETLLSVLSHASGRRIVDRVAVARNGWTPAPGSPRGILLDARPGTVALVDDICWGAPPKQVGSVPFARFDFELPVQQDEIEVVGMQGWEESDASRLPATSMIVKRVWPAKVREVKRAVHVAQRALDALNGPEKVLEKKEQVALAEIDSLRARYAADRRRHGMAIAHKQFAEQSGRCEGEVPSSELSTSDLVKAAASAHQKAALKKLELEILEQELAYAFAESKPEGDKKRNAELETAQTRLNAARKKHKQATHQFSLAENHEKYPSIGPVYPSKSTGRRKALADAITHPQNPLTARVAINHMWMRHFHSPLVSTVFDFGRSGAKPTHPELLDWLAVELQQSGWSMKHIHRLMVTSEAYQRSSASVSAPEADPSNRLYWRMNTGRMEAEVVRDSILFLSDRLDRTMGGQELENSEAMKTFRRSLYYCCQPEIDGKSEFGALFDAPEPTDCYRRSRSILPQQSLALTNSLLVHEASQSIAKQIRSLVPENGNAALELWISMAFEKILARSPSNKERQLCREYLAETQRERASEGTSKGEPKDLESLVRILLNHNDFVTIR